MIYKLLIEPMPSMPVLIPRDQESGSAFSEQFLTCKNIPTGFHVPEHVLKKNRFVYYDFINESSFPYCSERVAEIFSRIDKSIEFVPIWKDEQRKYFAINVVGLFDCLDQEKSAGFRDDQGRLITLRKYCFVESIIPHDLLMFRIPQLKSVGRIFVAEQFVALVKDKRLTGVGVRDPNDGLKKGLHGLPFAVLKGAGRNDAK